MSLEEVINLVEEINQVKEANKNTVCYYAGCSAKPIRSHVIAEKWLKLIAWENMVLAYPQQDTVLSDVFTSIATGVQQPREKLHLIGIGDIGKITDPIFCHSHDDKVFALIEKQELASCHDLLPKQVLLLSFRALSSLTLKLSNSSLIEAILEVSKKHNYQHSFSEQEKYARLQRFLATDTISSVYKQYNELHKLHEYNQVGYAVYIINMPPCIATTDAIIPASKEDHHAIMNGTLALTAEDVICFTFLPYKPLNKSICIIGWLQGSKRAKRFMNLNSINELSEKEQQDLFFTFAFESSTIYISPTWWFSLSAAKREEYINIHENKAREYLELL